MTVASAAGSPRWQQAVAVFGLAVMFVLPCLIGTLSSVLAVLAAMALLPVLRRPGALAQVRAEPGVMLLLAVFCALSLVFAVTARVPGDLLYVSNFLAFALAPVAYVGARAVAGRSFAARLAWLCLAGAALGAAYAVLEVAVLGHERAEGFFSNPNVMSRVAVVLGFAALGGVWLVEARRGLAFYLGPALSAVVVVLSGSRGAALALPPLALLALICFALDARTRRQLPALLAIVVGIALVALVVDPGGRIAAMPGAIADAIFGGTADDEAIAQRMTMYDAAVEAFRLSPWIGQGWGNLGNAAAAVDPENLGWAADYYFMYHNDVLNFAVAGGIVGIGCLLVLLAAPLTGLLHAPHDGVRLPRAYLCLMLTVGYAVLGLTDMTFGYDIETTLYAFLLAVVLGGFREEPAAAAVTPAERSAGARPAARP